MSKYSKAREEWIDSSREELLNFAKQYQSGIIKAIKDDFGPMLDLDGQKLKFSASNIGKTAMLDKIIGDVANLQGDKLLDWFFNQIDKNGKLNRSYFNTVVKNKTPKVQKAYQNSFDNILTRLGYDGKKFVKGGFLHDLTRVADPIRRIKAETVKAIATGSSYKDFVDQIDIFVQGQEDKAGIVESHFRTNAYDTFQMVDRSISLGMAKKLGMTKFVYSGTEMETTRDFCKDKIGKVFTIEQAEKWKNEEWQGKPKTNYDPLLDMGGYNCTHVPDWITDEMADAMEPKKEDIPVEDKKPKIDYTPSQIERAKSKYLEFLKERKVTYDDIQTVGRAEAENRVAFHNKIVQAIADGNKELEKEWKFFFLNEELKRDQKEAETKAKLLANKTASADILTPIKELRKIVEFGKWLNTAGNPYRSQHFTKKYTKEAVDAFLNQI